MNNQYPDNFQNNNQGQDASAWPQPQENPNLYGGQQPQADPNFYGQQPQRDPNFYGQQPQRDPNFYGQQPQNDPGLYGQQPQAFMGSSPLRIFHMISSSSDRGIHPYLTLMIIILQTFSALYHLYVCSSFHGLVFLLIQ